MSKLELLIEAEARQGLEVAGLDLPKDIKSDV